MKSDNHLNGAAKTGYLKPPAMGEAVLPELPPIEVDITSYADKPSFRETYRRVSGEIAREKARKNVTSSKMGFWESYLWGTGQAFKWMVKGIMFITFAAIGMWLFGRIF